MSKQGLVGDRLRQRLRDERERHGWSQPDLAARLKLHPTAISRIESGDRGVHVSELAAFADIFGASTDALMGRRRGGELAAAAANLTANAQKMASEIERMQSRLRNEYDDVREAVSVGGAAVTNLLEFGGSAILALSNARDWLNRLANQFPIPS